MYELLLWLLLLEMNLEETKNCTPPEFMKNEWVIAGHIT